MLPSRLHSAPMSANSSNQDRPGDPAKWAAEAQRRGCYCEIWEKDPQFYPSRGIARGYCGKCERCGAMGHTRHYPGPVPYTGSWCDRCYRIVGLTGWMRSPAGWIQMAFLALVLWFVGGLAVRLLGHMLR